MLLTSPPPGFSPDRCFFVALKGGDADNIADALTKVNGLTPAPSVADPAAIMVFPGVYSTPPFTIPAGVTIIGATGSARTILETTTAAAQFVTASPGAVIEQMTLRGANGVGGIGIGYIAGTAGSFQASEIRIDDCDTGVYVDGAGRTIRIRNVRCDACDNSFRVGSNGGILEGVGANAFNDTAGAWHLLVESATAQVRFADSFLRDDKFNVNANAEIYVLHVSDTPGEESIRVLGEFQVGSEVQPKESAFGGGDSHTRGMRVFTNTNQEAGAWADITSALILKDASTVALLPATTAGNCMYVGGDVKFPGIKIDNTTAMALGTGAVVLEYWNGTAWTEFLHMSSDADAPYNQYARAIFERANASEQVRFNTQIITPWAAKALNGTTKYWVRMRVVTAITTVPVGDKMKLHTHRTEINPDGILEYFGDAEPERELLWHKKLEELWDGNDPGDGLILVGPGVTIKGIDNKFQDGAADGKLSVVRVGPGLDTSRQLTFSMGWHPEPGKALAGFVELQVDGYVFKQGDRFDGTQTPLFTGSAIIDMTTFTNSDELRITQVNFTIPDRVPGDVLVLHVYRDGTGANLDDTYADHVFMVYTALDGIFWR